MTISSTLEEAAALAERIAGLFGAQPGRDAEAVDALRLCLAEALNNIVQHAYDGTPGRPIHAVVRPTPEGCAVLLADEGRPMPGGRAPRPDSGARDLDPADTASLPEGGFGWLLIEAQIDRVAYRRQNGRNLLRLYKRMASAAAPAPGSRPGFPEAGSRPMSAEPAPRGPSHGASGRGCDAPRRTPVCGT